MENTGVQMKEVAMVYRCYESGLLFYNAGIYSNILEFTPPLIITSDQVDTAVDTIDKAFDDVLNGRVDKVAAAKFAGWAV